MYENKTIIISCAGMGKRLGMGIPKALIEINGKPLIIRHLEMLKDCKDIRIVVGYKAQDVIKVVNKFRKDITFVFNHDYKNNGTGASVSLAAKYANKYIITIDGDLIIHPDDMQKILNENKPFVGVCKASTDNPVLTEIKDNKVIEFSRDHGQYEWTGVSQFESSKFENNDGHVYQLLEPMLPLKHLFLRTKEIDTPNDFDHAVKWLNNNYSDNITIGILGGMGSVATVDFFNRLVTAFPAEKEWDRPRIIIDNRCNMPSRVRAVLYHERYNELVHSLTESIKLLKDAGSDYIVLACNTSHIFIKDILSNDIELENKIINIIEKCAEKLTKDKIKEVKLLASEGTILSGIYVNTFKQYNIKIKNPKKEEFSKLRNWIEAVKQQKIDKETMDDFIKYINNSKDKNIILGCTELPILYELCKKKIKKNIVDPLECTIEYLKEKQNETK